MDFNTVYVSMPSSDSGASADAEVRPPALGRILVFLGASLVQIVGPQFETDREQARFLLLFTMV
jgi:hypothetical protein